MSPSLGATVIGLFSRGWFLKEAQALVNERNKTMKVFIVGGTGFVGTALTGALLRGGHTVTLMARHPKRNAISDEHVQFVPGDGTRPGKWQDVVGQHDWLINLAGVTVFRRWNAAYKKLLYDSRILTTRHLVEAIPKDSGSVRCLINTSGAGYYGFRGDEELTEEASPGNDFLSRLAQEWEAEAFKAVSKGVRVTVTRFGIVLGRHGGALQQMATPFKFFLGGPVGNGKQWIPWIHIEDLCRAILFVAEHEDMSGPVNFCAPEPVRNRDLAKAIGKALQRPSIFPAPGFMIKLVLGEFGSVILEGQRAVPAALLKHGFVFKYPQIEEALRDLLVG